VAAPSLATAEIVAAAPAPSVVVPLITPPAEPPAVATPAPAAEPQAASPAPSTEPRPSPPPPTLPSIEAAPQAALPGDAAAQEARLLEAINRLRTEHGLPPYAIVPELSAVARAHSCDLAAHGLISHTSSDGRFAMWLDEPPDGWHRRNLLDPEQQAVGAGYCAAPDDPSGNRFYWTIVVARGA
jgi:uncharacterized protein YkwD